MQMDRNPRSKLNLLDKNTKFMENFDPIQSNRVIRKKTRKFNNEAKRSILYDENGIHLATNKDLCDCLYEGCPGCHFPCPKPSCGSCKCGHECRQSRKWVYEQIEIEGTDEIVKNKFGKY